MNNSEITIEHHAYLYAELVKNACAVFGEAKGRELMAEATVRYGRRRGERMASHETAVLRNRDIVSFFAAGEWKGRPGENLSVLSFEDGTAVSRVRKCAWYDTWKKYGMLDYGPLYCHYVDEAICEGFAGSFHLQVEKAIGKGDDICLFRWSEDSCLQEVAEEKEKYGEKWILPFSFHCRELLKAAEDALCGEDARKGKQVIHMTRDALCAKYGDLCRQLFEPGFDQQMKRPE